MAYMSIEDWPISGWARSPYYNEIGAQHQSSFRKALTLTITMQQEHIVEINQSGNKITHGLLRVQQQNATQIFYTVTELTILFLFFNNYYKQQIEWLVEEARNMLLLKVGHLHTWSKKKILWLNIVMSFMTFFILFATWRVITSIMHPKTMETNLHSQILRIINSDNT